MMHHRSSPPLHTPPLHTHTPAHTPLHTPPPPLHGDDDAPHCREHADDANDADDAATQPIATQPTTHRAVGYAPTPLARVRHTS
jgi:hypothetical protein